MSVAAVTPLPPLDLANSSAVSKAQAAASTTTSTSSTTGSTTTGLGLTGTSTGTTFLNLLVKELQNQDPSAPMDSTAMVGQMISLNQLDQLITISQDLGGSTSASKTSTPGTSSTGTSNGQAVSSSALMAARTSLLNGNTDTSTAAQAATIAASDPASTLQLSTLNHFYGAK